MLIATIGFAQDIIVKNDGSNILAKVTNVSKSEVTYKKYDNQDGPTYTIKIKDLQCINYENGTTDTFKSPGYDPNIVTNENATQYSNDKELLEIYHDLKKKGKAEATKKEKEEKEKAKREKAEKKVAQKVVTPQMQFNRGKRLKVAGYTIGGTLLVAGLASVAIGVVQDKYAHEYLYVEGNHIVHGRHYNYDKGLWLYTGSGVAAAGIAIGVPLLMRGSALQKKNKDLIHSASAVSRDINFSNGSSLNLGIDVLSNSISYTNIPGIGIRYNF